jgi:hypothetical protein
MIRSDRGTEFTNQEVIQYLRDKNIRQELTAPYCLEQNGVTEWENCTLVEAARSMLHPRNIPLYFWREAVQTAAYMLNRTYTRLQPNSTPYKRWFGEKPSLAHTRIFGCDAFIHIPKAKRKKLDAKCHPGMFLGYSDKSKAYWVWDKITRRVVITRDIIFHENTTSDFSTTSILTCVPLLLQQIDSTPPNTTAPSAVPVQISGDINDADSQAPSWTATSLASTSSPTANPPAITPPTTRPQRLHKPVNFYGDWAKLATTMVTEPKTYHEATIGPDQAQWQQAMQDEYNSLLQNQTWSITNLPQGRNVVDRKWTYKLKFHVDGIVARFKSRLVAKGYSQRPGIDFFETYFPVVCVDSIRIILSIAAVDNLDIRQFDIATAFLNGTL